MLLIKWVHIYRVVKKILDEQNIKFCICENFKSAQTLCSICGYFSLFNFASTGINIFKNKYLNL